MRPIKTNSKTSWWNRFVLMTASIAVLGLTTTAADAQRGNRPEPQDNPAKGLRYDPATGRWVFDTPSQLPQAPGPILVPPTRATPAGPRFDNHSHSDRDRYFGPSVPQEFNWGNSLPQHPYGGQTHETHRFPQSPGLLDTSRYTSLSLQLSHNLEYLRALSARENLTNQQRIMVDNAAEHANHFAQLLARGGDAVSLQREFALFDQAWHPASHLFSTGAYSNRTLSVVQAINQLDNLFHAELNFGQAHAYDRDHVAQMAQSLVQLANAFEDETRHGGRSPIPRGNRLADRVSRAAKQFENTVRRDGDHDDVVKSFRNVENAWDDVHAAFFQGSEYVLRSWPTGRGMYQVIHDIRLELHIAPTQQQPVQLHQLVIQLQEDSLRIMQLVQQQGNRRLSYSAWAFTQDCKDLSVALSMGHGSFHRQIPQVLGTWREVRQGLDGQQFVPLINSIERNLRILETMCD